MKALCLTIISVCFLVLGLAAQESADNGLITEPKVKTQVHYKGDAIVNAGKTSAEILELPKNVITDRAPKSPKPSIYTTSVSKISLESEISNLELRLYDYSDEYMVENPDKIKKLEALIEQRKLQKSFLDSNINN